MNSIGQKFTPLSLLRFALPSIIMMVCMSMYTIVDGIFISRFASSDALSATNIVYPVCGLLLAISIMLATGGSALVARKLGEGKKQEAREDFSMIIMAGLVTSLILIIVTVPFAEPLSYLLGSNDAILSYCKKYLCIIMLFGPACMLQTLYQCFLVTAGKSNLGLGLTIAAGLTNAVLDYVFMGVLGMGVEGAALATGIGQMVPAVLGTIFFFCVRKELYFVKIKFRMKSLTETCSNGSSEMVSNISNSIITVLLNLILMKLAGADGVAAITIILYGQFLLSSLYMGFSIGVAPVFSFRFGAGQHDELRKLYKICLGFILVSSLAVTAISLIGAPTIVNTFVAKDSSTYALTVTGFTIFSASYLFMGFNVYSSSLFTALSDGKSSAIISFCRTFVFILLSLLILPNLLGITGVWLAIPTAEFLTFFLSIILSRTKLPLQNINCKA